MLFLLEGCQVLNTDQIKLIFFESVSIRMAQGRLKKLYEGKTLKRDRLSLDEPFFYYLDKRPGQLEHRLAVNWVYVWFHKVKAKKGWEKLHSFEWEVPYESIVRPDGFAAIKNIPYGKLTFYFVELDIAESGNAFDKVMRYTKLYKSRKFMDYWWGSVATGFPSIIVVTTTERKKKFILEKIAKGNECDLDFQVFTLDQIKEECNHGRNR